MSRKEQEIHSKQSTLQEVTNYTSTGYSNSRLGVHSVHPQNPKLSFDAMTIVGNLSRDNAQKLSEFMSTEPQIRLWDILQTKFKAKALQEKVYIEYDKVKADTWDRRNMRVEFNPNKFTHEEMIWLKQNSQQVYQLQQLQSRQLQINYNKKTIHKINRRTGWRHYHQLRKVLFVDCSVIHFFLVSLSSSPL